MMDTQNNLWYGTVGYSDLALANHLIIRVEQLSKGKFPNHNKRILKTKKCFGYSSDVVEYLRNLDIIYCSFTRDYETHPIWEPIA